MQHCPARAARQLAAAALALVLLLALAAPTPPPYRKNTASGC